MPNTECRLRRAWLTSSIALCTAGGVLGSSARPPAPKLSDLLQRIEAYVSTYGREASAFVGTETYSQSVTGSPEAKAPAERTTIAEFAIVRTSGSQPWLGFRDIVEVDGTPIPDHRSRLLALLTSASPDVDQARRLSEESARLNLGPIERNFNVPTTTLFFFLPGNMDRFRFKLERVERSDMFRVAFRETRKPTLIRTVSGESILSQGELLVDADGVVRETILRIQSFSNRKRAPIASTIDVQYEQPAGMDVWLPSRMTEEYVRKGGRESTRIETRADYSDYRQFIAAVKIK